MNFTTTYPDFSSGRGDSVRVPYTQHATGKPVNRKSIVHYLIENTRQRMKARRATTLSEFRSSLENVVRNEVAGFRNTTSFGCAPLPLLPLETSQTLPCLPSLHPDVNSWDWDMLEAQVIEEAYADLQLAHAENWLEAEDSEIAALASLAGTVDHHGLADSFQHDRGSYAPPHMSIWDSNDQTTRMSAEQAMLGSCDGGTSANPSAAVSHEIVYFHRGFRRAPTQTAS